MSKKLTIRVNNAVALDQIADPQPKEVVIYHWNRIVGVVIIGLVLLVALIWGAVMALRSDAESQRNNPDAEEIQLSSSPQQTKTDNRQPLSENEKPIFKDEVTPELTPITPPTAESAQQTLREPTVSPEELAASISASMAKGYARTDEPASDRQDDYSVREDDYADREENGSAATTASNQPAVKILSSAMKRAQLTSNVIDEEPVDQLGTFIPMNEQGLVKVYFFMETKGLKGQTLFHDWYWKGKHMARVRIPVPSNDYRHASSKFIDTIMVGSWEAKIVNSKDKVLAQAHFEVR